MASPTDRRLPASLNLQSQMVSSTDPRPSTTPYVAVIIVPENSPKIQKITNQILEPFHIEKYIYESHTNFIDSLTTKGMPIAVIVILPVMHVRLNIATYREDLQEVLNSVNDKTELFVVLMRYLISQDEGVARHIDGKNIIFSNHGYYPLQFTLDDKNSIIKDHHYMQSVKLFSEQTHIPVVVAAPAEAAAWAARVVILMLL